MNKRFEFDNVFILKPYLVLLMAFFCTPIFIIFAIYINKLIGLLLYIIVFFSILKLFKKNIKLIFKEKYVLLFINNKQKRYLKSEIIGFFSHDYPNSYQNSIISIQFRFKDGLRLEISDLAYRTKYDEDKGEMLKEFIITAQKEFNFRPINKNRWRSFIKMGSVWFSK